MSLRKMLKVSLLMLLAMALAATSAHARLDLFGQMLSSKNQPKPNSGDDNQVILWTKAKLDSIPYEECGNTCKGVCVCTLPYPPEYAVCVCMLPIKPEAAGKAIPTDQHVAKVKSERLPPEECQKTCKYVCACTLIWPPELSTCVCGAPVKSLTTKTAEELHKKLDLVSKPVAKSGGFIPYPECIEKCDECVICTLIYPIEKALCYCGKYTTSKSKIPAIQNSEVLVEESHKKLDSLPKPVATSGGGFIPYPECIEKCDECVICTKNYPIEEALCYCGKNTASNSNKPAIQNLGDDKQVVLWTKAKLDSLPYEECINTCKLGLCACTLPWPPELAICVCVLPIKPEAAGKAIPTDQQVAKVKSEILPFEECQKTCKYLCACTLIWPPELSTCVCGASVKSLTTKTAELHKKLDFVTKPVGKSGGFIPYLECIKKCYERVICTLIYPIEKTLCSYDKNTTSKFKKPAIQNSEESHKKLDSFSKPVATSGEGFIPYPECIEKCDECVICTKIYPIEKALCYCGKNTVSNSKKSAIQNSGDDKKMVLWTKAKLDSIPYEECIETCERCACTLPLPPVDPICICLSPKSAGRALPI